MLESENDGQFLVIIQKLFRIFACILGNRIAILMNLTPASNSSPETN